MVFRYQFEFGLENVNRHGEITNKALLQCLENVAAKHSEAVKQSKKGTTEDPITWFLLQWKMQVLDRPKYGDVLEVLTWSRNCTKLFAFRDFEIRVNGECKAIISSKWLLVNRETTRPMRITEELLKDYESEPERNVFEDEDITPVREPEEYERIIDYPIRKSDIDMNQHVHNLNYLDMALEVMDDSKEADFVNILYKKQITYEDSIQVALHCEDGKNCVKITDRTKGTLKALMELSTPE